MASLYTEQGKNIRKTWFLMTGFLVIVVALGWLIAQIYGNTFILYAAVAFSVVMNITAYWFSDKVDIFMKMPGEIVNSIFTRMIGAIDEKIKQEQPLTAEDYKNLRFFAEKHRSCQPFFTNRTEMDVKDFKESTARIIARLEETDYGPVALEAKKMLSTDSTVQNSSVQN